MTLWVSLGYEFLDLVLPRTCPGCGRAESWCADCQSTVANLPRRVVPPLSDDLLIHCPPIYALAQYGGPIRDAILAGKERNRRDLPLSLGISVGRAIERMVRIGIVDEPLWLVPAPTRRSASRRRGGDPVLRMARSAAKYLASQELPCGVAPCLVTDRRARDSVGLDATARLRNLAGAIQWRVAGAPPNRQPVILLDDVLTTGATTASATGVLTSHRHPVSAALVLSAVPPLC